jgi:4-hydroxy-tetrahydrodipicolinate synthase
MTSARLGTVLTAMVTPFDADGAVDFDVAAQLAKFLVDEGSNGLVVAGSTGEGSSLTDAERLDLFRCVAEVVNVPVIAGSTSSNTAHSVALTSRVAATGVAGVLATTPAYVRPSQAGIAAHLGAIADATTLAVMLYDIPSRTGRKIASATTIELVTRHSNVIALKDASTDLVAAAHTKAVLGDDFDLYSGDDGLTLSFMAIGAVGIVSVAAHWAGPEFAEMVGRVEDGDWTRARALNESLFASYAFESTESYPNPLPSKAALRFIGVPVGHCRLPHGPSDDALDAAAATVVTDLRDRRG